MRPIEMRVWTGMMKENTRKQGSQGIETNCWTDCMRDLWLIGSPNIVSTNGEKFRESVANLFNKCGIIETKRVLQRS